VLRESAPEKQGEITGFAGKPTGFAGNPKSKVPNPKQIPNKQNP
jgi:hypothetical protein